MTFDLYVDVEKLWVVVGGGWWVVVYLDYNVSFGPFLSFEIDIKDIPGPDLDNCQALGQALIKFKLMTSLVKAMLPVTPGWTGQGPYWSRPGLAA